MVNYATVTGRITIPQSDVGIPAKVIATPETKGRALTVNDRVTIGSVSAFTDAAGNLPTSGATALQIPTNHGIDGLLWRIVAHPLTSRYIDSEVELGVYEITGTSSTPLHSLVKIDQTLAKATAVANLQAIANQSAAQMAASNAQAAAARDAAISARNAAQLAQAAAEAAEQAANDLVLSDLGTSDGQMTAVAGNPSSGFAQALSAQIVAALDPAKYANAATAANTKRFLGKMRRATSDASLLIVSDSTGNATNEWAYLTTQHIAAEFPAWTVQLAFWNETSGTAYQATTTVQTGTNGRTLTVWVASKAGGDPGYFLGFRWAAAIAAIDPDLMLMSHGHNMGDPTLIDQRPLMLQFTEEFAATFPRAGIVLIAQNPTKTSGRTTWQAVRATVWEEIASLRGYGFIDVHQAFVDFGDWQTALMLDNDHPNNAGSAVWAAVVGAAFSDTDQPSAMVLPPPPLLTGAQDYITNGDFSAWDSTNPDGWTINLATTSKDTTNFESATRGMKLTASGSSGIAEATQDVSLTTRKHLRGQLVTLCVRVFVPASNTATVRIALQDSTGGANIRNADLPASTRDRYVWMLVSKRIDVSATYIRARLMVRTSGTAAVEATFDRAALVKGALPADRMEKIPGPAGESGPASPTQVDHLSTFGTNPLVTASLSAAQAGLGIANQGVFVPVKPHRNMTLNYLSWVSAAAAGNYDIGIYDAAGNKLWSKGAPTAWPAANTETREDVLPAVPLVAGTTYYVAFAQSDTTAKFRGLVLNQAFMRMVDGSFYARVMSAMMPLPASVALGAAHTQNVPGILLRES